MSDTPRIEIDAHGHATVYTNASGELKINYHDLKGVYQCLKLYIERGALINNTAWGGAVTADVDGTELITGFYGAYSVAEYVARKSVDKGQTKGARAWACLAEFGKYADERPPIADPDDMDADPDPEPAPAIKPAKPADTLDKWLEGIA